MGEGWREKERERERTDELPLVGYSENAVNNLGYARPKTDQEFCPSVPCGWQEAKYLCHHLMPPCRLAGS